MTWFFIAILGPIFWALTNHIDKYLLSKHLKGVGIGSLVIFSCLFAVVVLPALYLIYPDVLEIGLLQGAMLLIIGLLNTAGVLLYLSALNDEETSLVVPLFQLTPVFGFAFGYFLMGEVLSQNQLLGSILVVVGAFLFGIEYSKGFFSFRKKMIIYMFLATITFGLHGVLFKIIANDVSFSKAIFWEYVGLLFSGMLLYIFVKSYREQFIFLIKNNKFPVIALNFTNELFVLVGNLATAYALLLAPVAVVLSVGGLQPLFVLVLGVLITLLFPNLGREDLKGRVVFYKVSVMSLIVLGVYILNV